MLTWNPDGQEELITQLGQKAISKLYEIQCSFVINMLLKRKKNSWVFSFSEKLRQAIKFWKKLRNSH